MAGVQVSFGANIDKLVDGVDGVRSAIKGLETDLLAIAGIDLSVRGIESFISSMADLGEQTETVGTTLGLSNQKVIELSGFAKLTGTDITSLATGIERMSLNIQKSTKDGFNPAAQALRMLGLSARELVGQPADVWLQKLGAAADKFNPSLNLTNALMLIGGRGAAQMIASLRAAGTSYQDFKAQIDQATEGLAAAIPGMTNTHEQLTILGVSLQSFGARIFSVLKPAIDAAISALTRWLQSMDTGTIRSFATTLIDTLGNAVIGLIGIFYSFGASIDEVLSKLRRVLEGAALGGALGILGGGPITALGGAMLGAGIVGAWDDFIAGFDKGAGNAADHVKAEQTRIVGAIQGMMASIKSTITGGAGGGGPFAGAPSPGAGAAFGAVPQNGADAAKAQVEQYQAMIAQANSAYAQLKQIYGTDVATHKITVDQETANLRQALDTRWSIEEALFERELSKYPQGSAAYGAVLKQMLAAKEANAKELNNITDKQLEADAQAWNSMLSPVMSAWNSQLRGLLAGTESWSTAMKKIVGDLIIQLIEYFERLAVQQAALGLANTFHAGPQSMLGGLLGGGGSTAAMMTNNGLLTTLNGLMSSLVAVLGGGTVATTAQTTATTAETAATTAETAAQSASSAGSGILSGFRSLFSVFGLVAPFAEGTDFVASSGLAYIHRGEAVVPAQANTPFTGAGFGGGDTAKLLRGLLSDHRSQMTEMMNDNRKTTRGLWSAVDDLHDTIKRRR